MYVTNDPGQTFLLSALEVRQNCFVTCSTWCPPGMFLYFTLALGFDIFIVYNVYDILKLQTTAAVQLGDESVQPPGHSSLATSPPPWQRRCSRLERTSKRTAAIPIFLIISSITIKFFSLSCLFRLLSLCCAVFANCPCFYVYLFFPVFLSSSWLGGFVFLSSLSSSWLASLIFYVYLSFLSSDWLASTFLSVF